MAYPIPPELRPWSELADLKEIRFFTFLREPIARCLSHYQFECVENGREEDFLTWLSDHSNYQTRILSKSEDAAAAIEMLEKRIGFVGLLEEFDRSLDLFRTWSETPIDTRYRSRNISKRSMIKQRILSNPRWVAEIHAHHQADLRVYEYAKTVIFPRMIGQFRDSPNASSPAILRSSLWPSVKRNAVYKPAAKLRQWLRAA